ncbi:DUF1109 domain-containing protein [Burkholderia plantarii]|uniref:DUF1109 domain-containing protein n=1 Tax=Burkholderia plantarii TaxID=41899 RepID=A0A0B6RMP0_BURPL|nr:DUF1109 domain-containing protein [Burkholderia plantarii]AJK46592.1 hypothetical protein BGL_1c20830 [Burkholderia plantarii]WLE59434.1 DUF1109 domain-containing protein [Burkholderia plantarii]
MNTDELIMTLIDAPRPPGRAAVSRRLGLAALAGIVVALLLLPAIRGDTVRLAHALGTPLFWVKVMLPASMTLAALRVAARLARPGLAVGRAWLWLGLPLAAVSVAAVAVLAAAPPELRPALVLGHTWRTCSLYIVGLSGVPLVVLLHAMRGLAATRPSVAGTVAGLLAGAIGTLAYSFRCPETAVPFWAVWYSLGMAVPALIGALAGRRALRW